MAEKEKEGVGISEKDFFYTTVNINYEYIVDKDMLDFCKNDKNCVRNNSDNIKDISTLFKKCIDGYEKNKEKYGKNCSTIEALNYWSFKS